MFNQLRLLVDSQMLSHLQLGLLGITTLIFAMLLFLITTQNHREPLAPFFFVPFFGPLVGLLRHKTKFLLNLNEKCGLPILTLRVPFFRIYMVNSPELITSSQRRDTSSNFTPVGIDFGLLFSGLGKRTQERLGKAYAVDGNSLINAVHKNLRQGDKLNEVMSDATGSAFSTLQDWKITSQRDMYESVRHSITRATTDAIFGPENPFKDPEVEAAWNDFIPGIKYIASGFLPGVFARRSFEGHNRIVKAFETYFANGGHLKASPLMQQLYATHAAYGLDNREQAIFQIATCLALLSTGGISTFWLIVHIFSSQVILSEVRTELENNIVEVTRCGDGEPIYTANLSNIKDKCPILHSTLQEVFRVHSTVLIVKQITADTVLDDTYLLKKNSFLMIPGPIVHKDPKIWGPQVDSFNHHRFLGPNGKRIQPGSNTYRPFGAGSTLCPGRSFATNLILSVAAMVVLQFDIKPAQGEWKLPTTENADIWNAMPKPDHDVRVEVQARDGEWKFTWTDGRGL